jgi:PBP1b-binding outer membrane lipoprotein LpoB
MRRIIPFIALTITLSGCVEEPSPKASEKAAEAIEQAEQQGSVKERQRTIEEAAEEATKLIEADAKSEADELSRGDPTE